MSRRRRVDKVLGEDDQNHAAVGLTAGPLGVGRHGSVRTVGDGAYAVQRDTLLVQVTTHGFGPLLAVALVAFLGARGVGVALDLDIDVAIVGLQLGDEGVQPRLGLGR